MAWAVSETVEEHPAAVSRFQRMANAIMGCKRREELRPKAALHLQAAQAKKEKM
jgi:hypothetical protein